MTIEKLVGLKATSWQFLSNPKKYVGESKSSDRPLVEESTRQFRTARDILARRPSRHWSLGWSPPRAKSATFGSSPPTT